MELLAADSCHRQPFHYPCQGLPPRTRKNVGRKRARVASCPSGLFEGKASTKYPLASRKRISGAAGGADSQQQRINEPLENLHKELLEEGAGPNLAAQPAGLWSLQQGHDTVPAGST